MIVFLVVFLVVIVLTIIISISMHYVVTTKKPEDGKNRYVHQVSEVLEVCKIESQDDYVADRIESILDALRYGDVNSPPEAKGVEQVIMEKSTELLDNIRSKKNMDVSSNLEDLTQLIAERKVITKYKK